MRHVLLLVRITLFSALAICTPLSGQDLATPTPELTPPSEPSPALETPPVKVWNANEILSEARRVEERAAAQVSLISGLMEVFLAMLAIVLIVLIGVGLSEWRAVRDKTAEVVKEAKTAKTKADGIVAKMEGLANTTQEHSAQISALKEGLGEAWKELAKIWEELPELEAEWEEALARRPETKASLEDHDALVVICDQLKIPERPERTAELFFRLSKYSRVIGNFPRALIRLERALKLDPSLEPRGKFHYARTLAEWASREGRESKARAERLNLALSELESLRSIEGDTPPILLQMAWTLDEMDRPGEAVGYFRKARKAVTDKGGEEPWSDTYNLACYLAKANRPEEVLEELTTLIGKGTEWIEEASGEKVFATLRKDPDWSKEFENLLAEARKAV